MIFPLAFWICYWSSRAIQRLFMQPVIEDTACTISGITQIPSLRGNYRWALIFLMSLIGLIAACVSLLVGVSTPENMWKNLMVGALGFGVFSVLVCGYGFWIVFNEQQKCAWKWVVMIFMAFGLLAIGLPVHGNFFAIWAETALLNGVVWLGSGLATLYFYVRYPLCSSSQEQSKP